jgi:hypothetical protein
MTSERRRHDLYDELRELLSDDSADELMNYLPPVGWADVATKPDIGMVRHELDTCRAELRSEMSSLRTDLRAEMAMLRSDMQTEMAMLRSDMHTEMAGLRTDVQTEMAKAYLSLQRWTISTMIALAAIVFAAARLGL